MSTPLGENVKKNLLHIGLDANFDIENLIFQTTLELGAP